MSNIYDFDSNNQDSSILNGDSVENHQQEVDFLLSEFPSLTDLDSAPFTGVQLALGFREYEN
tara:strand:- start:389 stop:574 length:186 start_codon:yes stop_codon:yes gene_type:complete